MPIACSALSPTRRGETSSRACCRRRHRCRHWPSTTRCHLPPYRSTSQCSRELDSCPRKPVAASGSSVARSATCAPPLDCSTASRRYGAAGSSASTTCSPKKPTDPKEIAMPVLSTTKDAAALTLTLVADYDATPAQVWQMFADPRKLERWWGPPTWPATFGQHDFTVGGDAG